MCDAEPMKGSSWPSQHSRAIQETLQVVSQILGRYVAIVWVFGDCFHDDILQCDRNGTIEVTWRMRLLRSDLLQQAVLIITDEWCPKRQQLVERNAQRIDVGSMVDNDPL